MRYDCECSYCKNQVNEYVCSICLHNFNRCEYYNQFMDVECPPGLGVPLCPKCHPKDSFREWVSVKERFPEKEEQTPPNRILVYFQDDDLMGVQPDYAVIGPCDPYPYRGPSHWMLLPKPPKAS